LYGGAKLKAIADAVDNAEGRLFLRRITIVSPRGGKERGV